MAPFVLMCHRIEIHVMQSSLPVIMLKMLLALTYTLFTKKVHHLRIVA